MMGPAWLSLRGQVSSSLSSLPSYPTPSPTPLPFPFFPGKVEAQHIVASAPTDRNLCHFQVSIEPRFFIPSRAQDSS